MNNRIATFRGGPHSLCIGDITDGPLHRRCGRSDDPVELRRTRDRLEYAKPMPALGETARQPRADKATTTVMRIRIVVKARVVQDAFVSKKLP